MNVEVFMWSSFAMMNFGFGIADVLEGNHLWSLLEFLLSGVCVYCLIDTLGVI